MSSSLTKICSIPTSIFQSFLNKNQNRKYQIVLFSHYLIIFADIVILNELIRINITKLLFYYYAVIVLLLTRPISIYKRKQTFKESPEIPLWIN